MTTPSSPTVLPEIREELQLDKKIVEAGGYRVMREVEHRVESYDALLKEQSIDISRKAIDRVLPTMDVPPPRTEGLTTIISVVEEVLVVEKRLRLKEEIHITVIEEHRHQVGEVELREEKVKVERFESDPT